MTCSEVQRQSFDASLTNLPATLQAMMNDILRDLIDKGDTAAFMDDILVGPETEKGHDEISR